jgi:hypothetical protein
VTDTPPVPTRPEVSVVTPTTGNGNPMQISDDPYGQLGDLDLMSPSGGAYQTDVPRPRRDQEDDLLF